MLDSLKLIPVTVANGEGDHVHVTVSAHQAMALCMFMARGNMVTVHLLALQALRWPT